MAGKEKSAAQLKLYRADQDRKAQIEIDRVRKEAEEAKVKEQPDRAKPEGEAPPAKPAVPPAPRR